jgi:DNA topoisomerase IB
VIAFAAALPRIRARVADDLARPGLGRAKVLATVVRLLESTCAYVRDAAGADFSAKDFRTWAGTVLSVWPRCSATRGRSHTAAPCIPRCSTRMPTA